MAYHGYLPGLMQLLSKKKNPKVLEVGIDKGITLLPLVTAMAGYCESFMYMGIDIKVQEALTLTINYMPSPIPRSTFLMERNSLEVLPELVEQKMKFDLFLLDGDHNYHTVSEELKYVDNLLTPDGILLVDDYHGKWSERDMFYADRPGYEDVSAATKPVETELHGVKPAVDEWLAKNNWNSASLVEGEPLMISRMPFQPPSRQGQ